MACYLNETMTEIKDYAHNNGLSVQDACALYRTASEIKKNDAIHDFLKNPNGIPVELRNSFRQALEIELKEKR